MTTRNERSATARLRDVVEVLLDLGARDRDVAAVHPVLVSVGSLSDLLFRIILS